MKHRPTLLLIGLVSCLLLTASPCRARSFETAPGRRLRADELIAARRLLVGCARYLDQRCAGREGEILTFVRGPFTHGWALARERAREVIWWRKALAGSSSVVRAALAPGEVRVLGQGLTELGFFFRPDSFGPDEGKRRRAASDLRVVLRGVRSALDVLLRRPVFSTSPLAGWEATGDDLFGQSPEKEPAYADLGQEQVQEDPSANAPEPTKPPSSTVADVTHRVVWGDTLSEIIVDAFKEAGVRSDLPLYGSGSLVEIVAAANGIEDPNLIFPGQSITIPAALLGGEKSVATDDDAPGQDADLVFAL